MDTVFNSREERIMQEWESKLINYVKMHPNLYDFNNKGYKESRRCVKTWRIIARELGVSGQWRMCKERWRTLRDVYVRNRKSYLVGGELSRRRPRWKFFDQMNFLGSYINHRDIEAEKNHLDFRILCQGNDPSSIASDSDSNEASTVLLQGGTPSSPGVPLSKSGKCKRELPEEDGPEGSERNTKSDHSSDRLSVKQEKKKKWSSAVEDFEAALWRETEPLAVTWDGKPIKQEVEWIDEDVDMVDKGLLKTESPTPSPTPPPPPSTVEDNKPLMVNLKLPGGKSIPATFITAPKQALITRKVETIIPTPLKSVPIKIKTVTGSQLKASLKTPVLPQQPSPASQQGVTPGLKEEGTNCGIPRDSKNSTPSLEQVHRSAVNVSTPQEGVHEDEEELFGRYVGAAIRKLTSKSKSLSKMRIQQVLFHLEEVDRIELNKKNTVMAFSTK